MNYLDTKEWKEFIKWIEANKIRWMVESVIVNTIGEAMNKKQIKEKEQ